MKRILLSILLCVILATPALAREKTLLGGGRVIHGGFGGPVVKFTSIDEEFGVLVGGRGGWIINHSLVLGGGGYWLSNEVEYDFHRLKSETLDFGYGGFEMEYVMFPKEVVHISFQTLIGGGSVGFDADDMEGFFITEPGVNLMLNVTPYFRMGFGGSYRFINGVDNFLDDEDLNGFSGTMTFKFGAF